MIVGQAILFEKVPEPHSHIIRVDAPSRMLAFRKEHRVRENIPLVTIFFGSAEIKFAVLTEHIHNALVHIQPAISRIGLTAVRNVVARAVLSEMSANMYSALLEINIAPSQRAHLADTSARREQKTKEYLLNIVFFVGIKRGEEFLQIVFAYC